MKALVLEEYNKLVYKDFPDPLLADDEVLVRVLAPALRRHVALSPFQNLE